MFTRHLSKREKIIALIAVVLGLVFVVYNQIIDRVWGYWSALSSQVEAKANIFKKNSDLLNRYKALEAEYVKYSAYKKVGKKEQAELTKTLGEIENVSKKSSCHIANVKPRTAKKLGNYREISFEVATEGNIDELSRFLYEIETSKECLRVRRFTITSKSGPQQMLKCTFLISKIIVS